MKKVGIIGAGVVGLAIGRRFARSGYQVILMERNSLIGLETSSRNSQVIHAGIYYPKNSLKAELSVLGKQQLYQFCSEYHIPFKKTGKFIVASSPTQHEILLKLQQKALANGVFDLELITNKHQLKQYEPNLIAESALYSPSTGIIDVQALMLALLGDAETHGAVCAFNTTVHSGFYQDNRLWLEFTSTDGSKAKEPFDFVINSAGLQALRMANSFTSNYPLPSHVAKGHYFRYKSVTSPFSHLIYPIPEIGGLGVHSTLDLNGQTRFGPNVDWIESNQYDYTVDETFRHDFVKAIQQYYPDLKEEALEPDYSGIRPKITCPAMNSFTKESNHDFQIVKARIPGLIHLLGIESPGLTACLAIADKVFSLSH